MEEDQLRIKTEIPGMETILCGGLIRGGTYTILGPPGSGKTIFANQFSFNHIKINNNKALYMTLLSESHGKMLVNLSSLSFFDQEAVKEGIIYLSGYPFLKKEGLKGLLGLIKKAVLDNKANIFVLDGLQVLNHFTKKKVEFLEFLLELQSFTNMVNCTSLLLSSCVVLNDQESENFMVDGIIELNYNMTGPRSIRQVTVHKLRNSNFLSGKHQFEINSDGIHVYPRTEAQWNILQNYKDNEQFPKLTFGGYELDELLGQGPSPGTSYLIIGEPGTGKTMLGLSYLVANAEKGVRGLYYGFHESTEHLIKNAHEAGIPLDKYLKNGLIEIMWYPPREQLIDALATDLLDKIKTSTPRFRTLFIDGADGFSAGTVYPDRTPKFLSALAHHLRTLNVATLISEELQFFTKDVRLPSPELGIICEGILLLESECIGQRVNRTAKIIKLKETDFDHSRRKFTLSNNGMHFEARKAN